MAQPGAKYGDTARGGPAYGLPPARSPKLVQIGTPGGPKSAWTVPSL